MIIKTLSFYLSFWDCWLSFKDRPNSSIRNYQVEICHEAKRRQLSHWTTCKTLRTWKFNFLCQDLSQPLHHLHMVKLHTPPKGKKEGQENRIPPTWPTARTFLWWARYTVFEQLLFMHVIIRRCEKCTPINSTTKEKKTTLGGGRKSQYSERRRLFFREMHCDLCKIFYTVVV